MRVLLSKRARARRPSLRLVRWLFVKGLGAIYFIAFRSLGVQVRGLYGARGILPMQDFLDRLREVTGRERYWRFPSLLWLGARDDDLVRLCRAGERCALLLVAGVAPRAMLAALWALYLSFVTVGREFLGYQWDSLLVENGLDALLVAPRGLAPGRGRREPPWPAVALLRALAYRLYFESGAAKLESRDPTWRKWTANTYHYRTQPLPTPLGWYAHHLPRTLQRASTGMTLALECGMPLAALLPRRARRLTVAAATAFQGLIESTGNYGFFNLLTAVDGLWLLDDRAFGRLADRRARRASGWRRLTTAVAALPLAATTAAIAVARLKRGVTLPKPIARLYRALAPLHAVNTYGLFAVMTTSRPEIVVEGSDDGVTWREYLFRYKPGPLDRRPPVVAPHQPRLDWQMWFAALAPVPAWFPRFLERLLQGTPEVLALLDPATPFRDRPPRAVRALLYDYDMTDLPTRRATGRYWTRTLRGLYFPACALAGAAAGAADESR